MQGLIRLGLGLAWLSACAGGTPTSNNNQNPPAPPQGTPAAVATISVQDDYFNPNSVLLAVNGTVTWNWIGDNGHSVTPDGSPSFSPTATISYPPKSLAVTFSATGDYRFYCTSHGVPNYYSAGSMIGAVYVR